MHRLTFGQKFSRLTAIAHDPRSVTSQPKWMFECDCSRVVSLRVSKVARGLVKSCGCLRAGNNRQHGGVGTPEYKIWLGVRKRCLSKGSGSKNYGARGIRICKRWYDSFDAFRQDMGPRPEGQWIERIDNDGPYSPENCRWATQAEQARNKRNNHLLTMNGQTKTLAEWSRETGLPRLCIYQRLTRLGWSTEKALMTPKTF